MIYEYKCVACKNYFAIERSINAPIVKGAHPGVRCKRCRSLRVKKVISYPSIQFKGDGFTLSKGEK